MARKSLYIIQKIAQEVLTSTASSSKPIERSSFLFQLIIVDGKWSDWMQTSSCSATCGNGTQTYLRPCTNPRPTWGGQECQGIGERTEVCNVGDCPPGM